MTTSAVSADAKFLRRVLFGLVFLTLIAGAMAALTTVQAMDKDGVQGCILFCE